MERHKIRHSGWSISPSEIVVSLDDTQRDRSSRKRTIRYTFMSWDSFERISSVGGVRIELQTNSELLLRSARDYLTPKKKRQELKQLLDDLHDNLRSVPKVDAAEALAIAKRLGSKLAESDRIATDLTEALISSGALDAHIEAAKSLLFKEYVETRAAAAEAIIAASVQQKQQVLKSLKEEINVYEELLQQERAKARADLDLELKKKHEDAEIQHAKDREALNEQREALRREQETLVKTIERAADRFTSGRSGLLSDMLALVPALQATGVLQPSVGERAVEVSAPIVSSPLPLPAAFLAIHPAPGERQSERKFFDRFVGHVTAQGYSYRDIDLRAFHLLVKCGDLTGTRRALWYW